MDTRVSREITRIMKKDREVKHRDRNKLTERVRSRMMRRKKNHDWETSKGFFHDRNEDDHHHDNHEAHHDHSRLFIMITISESLSLSLLQVSNKI